MTEPPKSLHAQNALWVAGYVTLHVVAFISLATQGVLDPSAVKEIVSGIWSTEGAIAAMAIVVSTVFNGLLSGNTKAILVFWRFPHPLPGHRAFTQLGLKDPRIDMMALEARVGSLPSAPEEQNFAWYKLYRHYRDDPAVDESHRRYLLTRDLAVLTLLFLLALPGALYLTGAEAKLITEYSLALFSIYILTSLASQRYAIALVTNVLAVASDQGDKA